MKNASCEVLAHLIYQHSKTLLPLWVEPMWSRESTFCCYSCDNEFVILTSEVQHKQLGDRGVYTDN